MSYLIVNTNEQGILTLDFGVYYAAKVVPFQKASYSKGYMVKVHLMEDHILVWGEDIRTFTLIVEGIDTTKGLIVESINGVVPTDLNHLFDLINNVM